MAANDRIRKVDALVISHRDFGEADRIIKLYTREAGKLKRANCRRGRRVSPRCREPNRGSWGAVNYQLPTINYQLLTINY